MKLKFYALIILFVLISGCTQDKETIDLSISREPDIKKDDNSVKVAIASVISPKKSYSHYEEMIDYFTEKLDGPVKIVQRRSYQEVNDLIKDNQIDFAFVCSGAYIDGNSEFGMKLLVAPQMYGKTTYQSYIIAPENSDYSDIFDFRNRKFAFSDPLSNSGKLYPSYRISQINETPESFFGVDEKGNFNYFFTYSHDNSVVAVAVGLADGAAVDSLVYENMKIIEPETVARTKVIEESPQFGIPPVVVPGNIDPFLESKLKEIFLDMDKDEDGKRILSRIGIEKFVEINDSAYDSVREMRKRVK